MSSVFQFFEQLTPTDGGGGTSKDVEERLNYTGSYTPPIGRCRGRIGIHGNPGSRNTWEAS